MTFWPRRFRLMTQKMHESSPPLLSVSLLHCGDAVYVPPTPNAGKTKGAALDVGGDEIKKSRFTVSDGSWHVSLEQSQSKQCLSDRCSC